jgi:hypothetical protein
LRVFYRFYVRATAIFVERSVKRVDLHGRTIQRNSRYGKLLNCSLKD